MDIAVLLFLILINGFFAMTEIALVTARRGRLQRLADDGSRGAQAAIELNEHPTRFLSTIQIGITAIGVLSGIIGEATLARPFAAWLELIGVPQSTSETGATILVVVVITYVTIILGELVPKRLGQLNPESIARAVAQPMLWLATIARPFVRLLVGSTELVLTVLGVRQTGAQQVTEEEIHAILEEGSDAGVIAENEREMVRNLFRLDDRQVASFMTPRSDILYLDLDNPLSENLQLIKDSKHSRFPVCRGDPSDIIGIVTAKRLLAQSIAGETIDLERDLSPPVYVPETLTGMELLQHFRSSNTHGVLVIDEYGQLQGMVSLHDVFEAIIGEFKPRSADDAWAIQREDGSWLLDGFIPVPEFKDRLDLDKIPEEERGRYHTLSGMLMLLTGKIPKTGDKVEWEDWSFEIVDMDGRRIDKVLAVRVKPAADKTSAPETPPGTTST